MSQVCYETLLYIIRPVSHRILNHLASHPPPKNYLLVGILKSYHPDFNADQLLDMALWVELAVKREGDLVLYKDWVVVLVVSFILARVLISPVLDCMVFIPTTQSPWNILPCGCSTQTVKLGAQCTFSVKTNTNGLVTGGGTELEGCWTMLSWSEMFLR